MPSSWQARITRSAISPRLAMRTLENISWFLACHPQPSEQVRASAATGFSLRRGGTAWARTNTDTHAHTRTHTDKKQLLFLMSIERSLSALVGVAVVRVRLCPTLLRS